jgi:hypothetical protein
MKIRSGGDPIRTAKFNLKQVEREEKRQLKTLPKISHIPELKQIAEEHLRQLAEYKAALQKTLGIEPKSESDDQQKT